MILQDGETALMLAAMYGHQHCVAALIAAGADCKAKDNVRFCRFHQPIVPSRLRHDGVF